MNSNQFNNIKNSSNQNSLILNSEAVSGGTLFAYELPTIYNSNHKKSVIKSPSLHFLTQKNSLFDSIMNILIENNNDIIKMMKMIEIILKYL